MSFTKGMMSPSQRQIASKVTAKRIKHLLPNLINNNQSGYIPDRHIGENTRSILDIMDYTKARVLPDLLFLGFEKAFDSLEWDFLEKCLDLFNFGTDLLSFRNQEILKG